MIHPLNEPDICPYCGSVDVCRGMVEHEEDEMSVRLASCECCGRQWHDWYEIVHVYTHRMDDEGEEIDGSERTGEIGDET